MVSKVPELIVRTSLNKHWLLDIYFLDTSVSMTDHIYVALARSLDLLAAERIERCALAHQPLDGTDAVSLCRSLGISEQLLDSSLDSLQVDGAILVEFHSLIQSLQLILLLVDVILPQFGIK